MCYQMSYPLFVRSIVGGRGDGLSESRRMAAPADSPEGGAGEERLSI